MPYALEHQPQQLSPSSHKYAHTYTHAGTHTWPIGAVAALQEVDVLVEHKVAEVKDDLEGPCLKARK